MAYEATGGPQELEFTDEIVGMTKWFDGTLLDLIWKVKE
jgi:citrate lyase alpha subunit